MDLGPVEITAIFSKQDGFDWLIRLLIKPNVDILTFLGIQVLMHHNRS